MAHGQWTEIEARAVLEAWKRNGVGMVAGVPSLGRLGRQRRHELSPQSGVAREDAKIPVLVRRQRGGFARLATDFVEPRGMTRRRRATRPRPNPMCYAKLERTLLPCQVN